MQATPPQVGWLFWSSAVLALLATGRALRDARHGRALRCALFAYAAVSALVLAYYDAFFRHPRAVSAELLRAGPISDLDVTLTCVVMAWLLLGSLLVCLARSGRDAEAALSAGAAHLVVWLYLNVVRERSQFGDVADYLRAASELAAGAKLHGRYLYPPFFATLLQPLVRYGAATSVLVCLVANFVSLGLLFVLLERVLQRYGFARVTATLATFVLLSVNVAVLRSLLYAQTNFHVANLCLLSLVLYPAWPLASGLAVALAAHIKTSPLVLAGAFLFARDLRWLVGFAAGAAGVVAFTSYVNGFGHYAEYLANVSNLYAANGVEYRENSIDSLFRASALLFGRSEDSVRIPIALARGAVFLFLAWVWLQAVRNRSFSRGKLGREAIALDSYPVLLFLLMAISPLVWEHHPVLIVPTFLVLLVKLDDPVDCVLWLLAWFLVYAVPTFDLYPLSFHLLLGEGLTAWLLTRVVRRGTGHGRYFARANRALGVLLAPDAEPAQRLNRTG